MSSSSETSSVTFLAKEWWPSQATGGLPKWQPQELQTLTQQQKQLKCGAYISAVTMSIIVERDAEGTH